MQAVDALAVALATGRAPPRRLLAGGVAAASPLVTTASAGTAAAAVTQTIGTYLAMGRASDRRNVHFLRTALSGEADPAVRLAVAEALYRSEPDGDSTRRAFLEAIGPAPAPAALGALLATAEPSDPTPVLAALAELAADGSGEALGRLVALAPRVEGSPRVKTGLGEVLVDLAGIVPEPLREAAAAATPEARAALAALVGEALPGLAGPVATAPTIGPAPAGPVAPAPATGPAPR
jgi:D-alanyl-D-alanine carboxypeptidase/D-alanyl-D-alanine-endopeptidase (penicillin-binding protein 4)